MLLSGSLMHRGAAASTETSRPISRPRSGQYIIGTAALASPGRRIAIFDRSMAEPRYDLLHHREPATRAPGAAVRRSGLDQLVVLQPQHRRPERGGRPRAVDCGPRRPSRRGRWRAATLALVYVAAAIHVAQWKLTGR